MGLGRSTLSCSVKALPPQLLGENIAFDATVVGLSVKRRMKIFLSLLDRI
jgi:hypothetical protein